MDTKKQKTAKEKFFGLRILSRAAWFCYAKWPLFHPEQFAPRPAAFAAWWGWAEEVVRAVGILGQRWMRMWSQGFQALIWFLVCFPKAKDKGEKVWHANTSWISEDKNRFWLYFSKIEVTVVWWQAESPSLNFFFLFLTFLYFFFRWRDRFLFLIHCTHWVSDSIFRFWSLWPQDQGLAPTFRPPCPTGSNFTDNTAEESNLLNLVTVN